jgi:SAM-dependent methyltransferase
MPETTRRQVSPERPEAMALLDLITGKWLSQAVYVAAELGVADILKDGPRSSADLARLTSSKEDGIYRLLRALTNVGLFTERAGRQFELTSLGQYLRSDVPGSLRGFARFVGVEPMWRAWGHLLHSVRTGEPAFDHVFGMGVFDYAAKDPATAAVFNDGMTSISTMDAIAVATAFDFNEIRKLVDVGGGHGLLLATILKANPGMEGILFEMAHALEGAKDLFQIEGIANRCKVVGGDFFETVPEGGDAYIMKHIIHDWDDEHSLKILRNCHRAMRPSGKLLLVEAVVPQPNEPHFAKLLDLEMLALTHGGRERTEQEFRKLYETAGFKLTRTVPTLSPSWVIEGVRV